MAEKIDIEESISKDRFVQLIREFADSVEKSSDFQLVIQGKQVTVPTQGEMKGEFESKEKGGEFNFKIKWSSAA
ncbi:MAG TPA: hypothetical protein VE439_07910 [Anaerolineae bacterium]|jgi:amphi-Trp domain-containing protein|nr:hypothetical protein [Anaerolineae bacterium]